jgi:Fe2+ transport system protein FeoA
MASHDENSAVSVRLGEIEPGHCGIVREFVAGEGDADALKTMGVCVGRKVMLIQPGDPLILKVMGTRLGVSARLAARVLVEPCGGDAFGGIQRGTDGAG